MNAVTMREETNVVPADAGTLMSVISRAASDPNTDVDKLERLLGMYERITAENALLQHEQTQINLARGAAEAEYRIAESRAREAQMQQATRTGRLADFIPR